MSGQPVPEVRKSAICNIYVHIFMMKLYVRNEQSIVPSKVSRGRPLVRLRIFFSYRASIPLPKCLFVAHHTSSVSVFLFLAHTRTHNTTHFLSCVGQISACQRPSCAMGCIIAATTTSRDKCVQSCRAAAECVCVSGWLDQRVCTAIWQCNTRATSACST